MFGPDNMRRHETQATDLELAISTRKQMECRPRHRAMQTRPLIMTDQNRPSLEVIVLGDQMVSVGDGRSKSRFRGKNEVSLRETWGFETLLSPSSWREILP